MAEPKYTIDDEDAAILGQCLDWISMMSEMQIDDASREGMIAVIKIMAMRFGIPFQEVEETQLEDGSFHVEVKDVDLDDEDEDPQDAIIH